MTENFCEITEHVLYRSFVIFLLYIMCIYREATPNYDFIDVNDIQHGSYMTGQIASLSTKKPGVIKLLS